MPTRSFAAALVDLKTVSPYGGGTGTLASWASAHRELRLAGRSGVVGKGGCQLADGVVECRLSRGVGRGGQGGQL